MNSGLIPCKENCKYQENGECSLENVPKFCLELNSKKACIYYAERKDCAKGREKPDFEAYF